MFFNVSDFAGTGVRGGEDGPVATASFDRPRTITVAPGGVVYVVEGPVANRIRKIQGGIVSTLSRNQLGYEDGPLSTALFNGPEGIVSDHEGNLYVADR